MWKIGSYKTMQAYDQHVFVGEFPHKPREYCVYFVESELSMVISIAVLPNIVSAMCLVSTLNGCADWHTGTWGNFTSTI